MVFLHPTILRDPTTADYYSRSKYDDLRLAQQGLFDNEDDFTQRSRPKLPELHLYFEGQRVNRGAESFNTILPTTSAIPELEPIVPNVDEEPTDNLESENELPNLLPASPDSVSDALLGNAEDSIVGDEAILEAVPTRNAIASTELEKDGIIELDYASSVDTEIDLETDALPLNETVTDLIASASLESDLIGSDDALVDLIQQTLE